MQGIAEKEVYGTEEVLAFLSIGQAMRATRATDMNDTSSRSHAVLLLQLKKPESAPLPYPNLLLYLRFVLSGQLHGQLTLIDLAGSEKGSDTPNSDKKTRNEAAEINKSLLALKECIRALDMEASHAPVRFTSIDLNSISLPARISSSSTVPLLQADNASPGCPH